MSRARNLARTQAAHEHVALPFRKLVACVESHAGESDRRHPEDKGLLEAFVRDSFGLPWSLVRAAEAHDRPAVVASGADDVDFIAAVGSVLVFPHLAGSRMNRKSD